MKIEFDPLYVNPKNAIQCLSDSCRFFASCANHHTAGDFRTEDGFSPELMLLDGALECFTSEEECLDVSIEILPDTYNRLGRGCVTWEEIKNKGTL